MPVELKGGPAEGAMETQARAEQALNAAGADWRATCGWTLVMRSTYGNAVAVIPGFPDRDSALRAAKVAEGHPNTNEYGDTKDTESVSSAAPQVPKWTDIVILPVPR